MGINNSISIILKISVKLNIIRYSIIFRAQYLLAVAARKQTSSSDISTAQYGFPPRKQH